MRPTNFLICHHWGQNISWFATIWGELFSAEDFFDGMPSSAVWCKRRFIMGAALKPLDTLVFCNARYDSWGVFNRVSMIAETPPPLRSLPYASEWESFSLHTRKYISVCFLHSTLELIWFWTRGIIIRLENSN